MRAKIKREYCPYCFGEIVIDEGITCIDGHDLNGLEFHPETMAKIQPVIDWVRAPRGHEHG